MIRLLPSCLALGLLAGVAHAQERAWTLDASDEDAYLIFGVPESDDVGVSLWCPIGKGVVNLYLPVPTAELARLAEAAKERAAPLTIAAGSETATFRGKADLNREAAVSSLEVEIEVQHPIVAALTTADRFTVRSGQTEIVFPLYEADVEGLLELCRKS
jgi:hypothetical protein